MGLLEGIKVPSSAAAVVVSAGACIVGGGILGGLIMKKAIKTGNDDTLPEKWVKVAEIKELVIYPIKGMPGVSVNEAVLASMGLKGTDNSLLRDRVFVIVNDEGKTFSGTKFPMLALTRAKVEGQKLHLSHINDPAMDITVDIPTCGGDGSSIITANYHGEPFKGIDCGDEVAAWLSRLTETPNLRLIYHVEEDSQRGPVKRNIRFPTYRASHTGAFHDETSYMLMTEESLAALNAQLDKPVTHKNFRPNIVVSGVSEPFSEDFWGFVRIGQQDSAPVLKNSLPCQRCVMTTVDPETGTFRTDGEPLKTLYRLKRPVGDAKTTKLVSKAAIMGAHFGVFGGQGSIIRVGDPVYAALV